MGLSLSDANKRLTLHANSFKCNTYKKREGACHLGCPIFHPVGARTLGPYSSPIAAFRHWCNNSQWRQILRHPETTPLPLVSKSM